MWLYRIFFLFLVFQNSIAHDADSEFAEFEDFDDDNSAIFNAAGEEKDSSAATKYSVVGDDDSNEFISSDESDSFANDEESDEVLVDIEVDSEFEHFQDADEFEGFEEKEEKPLVEPKITIAKVPVNFRQSWDSYYLEILMIFGLFVYFINFALGKSKNTKIANAWFQTHKQLLEENFAMVGDDGNLERNDNVKMIKESENVFTLWCSGRTCCEGMLVELRLIKRQDLVAIIANMMKPSLDQVQITVRMNKEDMENFIFAVASKKTALHISKDLQDISIYCSERKAGEKYNIPSSFQVMSEIAESTSAMLDSKIIAVLNNYTECVDYIHFSDQYSGLKPTEEATSPTLKQPQVQKVLRFGFNIPVKGMPLEEAQKRLKPLMVMVFYCINKVKNYRLSKEGKHKADKNRQKVEEAFLKSTHQARAEAAAAKREEKKRLEKERIMAEDDPEKQRRWEIREEKRQAKKRAPRMKQLKVKAL
ncbi:PAT complex subunit CCDC47 [Rhynchophorus ferrugineus]|uniref:PAT complex subunit CCDC47 n=1 Tax=Rhynchophorus ferrugineus TaxID=354439 RepID=UPI003FCE784B